MAQCKRFLFLLLLVFLAPNLTAGVFTSKDAAFTLDAPSGWAPAKNPPADSVLSLHGTKNPKYMNRKINNTINVLNKMTKFKTIT